MSAARLSNAGVTTLGVENGLSARKSGRITLRRGLVHSLLLAAVTGTLAAGCRSEDEPGTGSPSGPSIEDVLIEGTATDEALQALLDAKPIDQPVRYVAFDEPAANAKLTATAPLTFTLYEPASAAHSLPPADFSHSPRKPAGRRQTDHSTWFARVARILNPISIAHAHGTPFSGTGYLFDFQDARGKSSYAVFTSERSTILGLDVLADLKQVAQPLTLHVTSADFEDNRIPSGGGPFAAGSLTFSIE
ncbi:MAG TPA: hypothetical protein VFQ61_33130 [Polyangiaceae bacterium]|nr:hypothetical protein [Polyangiaceae bacterium]